MNYLCFRCCYTDKRVSSDDWKDEWHYCKVIDIYDGDTCTVKLKRNGKWIEQKIRMSGYDSPEMKPLKTKENRDQEIILAHKAKEYLHQLIKEKVIYLHSIGREKYGRILGHLHTVDSLGRAQYPSINTQMIEKGHGRPYTGGTKEEW